MRDNAEENEYFHEEWDSLLDYMKMDGILRGLSRCPWKDTSRGLDAFTSFCGFRVGKWGNGEILGTGEGDDFVGFTMFPFLGYAYRWGSKSVEVGEYRCFLL